MSPAGVGPENDCAVEVQQQLYTRDPSSRQGGCYIKTMKASIQLKNISVVSLKGFVAKRTDRR
jgi:hypothetical protein